MPFRAEYLRSALEITEPDYNDATDYVLNPLVVTPEGEWEAWIINWWKPLEVRRYRSFWDLMQAEYRCFLQTKQ